MKYETFNPNTHNRLIVGSNHTESTFYSQPILETYIYS